MDLCLSLSKDGLDSQMLSFLMELPSTEESLKPYWTKINYYFEADVPRVTRIPDIIVWMDCLMLFSQKAFDVFSPLLNNIGEFLLITINEQPFYVLNVQTFGKEDTSATVREYYEGLEGDLTHLSFIDADVKNKLIFKNKQYNGGILFANEMFKSLCEKHNFCGLRFDDNLINPF
ncbi:hypothetical protein [Photobacterium nomapromontoriensis]|uniref:hypothetical protein n=1 Tax=Photobacterium nomapromontoriensis TaxID=2910237 RepID=UPI003D1197F0